MRTIVTTVALSLGLAGSLRGQGEVRAGLGDRVPAAVAAAVQRLADSAAADRLPVQPLIDKALEGAAKGAPPDRIIAAVRMIQRRLSEAAGAIRGVRASLADSPSIEAGAFAVSAGLRPSQVQALARANRTAYPLAVTLRVAGTLAASGVPGEDAVQLVTQVIESGRSMADLLDLPHRVQLGTAQGASPAQAAAGIVHGGAPGGQSDQPHGAPANPGQSHKP